MPRVSAKIHKFLKELALTSDEKAALREDIGAVAGADVVSDTDYNEATWNGVTTIAPSKNAVRDKFESLLDPTALTHAGANPNSILTISGTFADATATPVTFPPVWKDGSLLPDRTWVDYEHLSAVPDYAVYHNGTSWRMLGPTGDLFNAVGAANADPTELTWTNIGAATGANTVTITGDIIGAVATHLGQWCKASTAWWQWVGAIWIPRQTLTGQQITRNDADDAYFILGVDGDGAPTTTPFP